MIPPLATATATIARRTRHMSEDTGARPAVAGAAASADDSQA